MDTIWRQQESLALPSLRLEKLLTRPTGAKKFRTRFSGRRYSRLLTKTVRFLASSESPCKRLHSFLWFMPGIFSGKKAKNY